VLQIVRGKAGEIQRNMKKLLLILFAGVFLISACGPAPEPTMSAEDVQGTAVAAAWTMVAETEAAIPTATPIPPTETPSPTPLPTNTILPLELPTQALVIQPTATTASSTDECNRVLTSPDGPQTTLLISNETKAPIGITIGLLKNVFGECGYLYYIIPKNGSSRVTVPLGCYWAYAYVNDPKQPTTVEGGGYCMNNTDKWTMVVRRENIILNPP
jgi:hypothetical protein